MPRRGFLNGVAEWLRFGLGVADQAQTSTPALEDTMQLVLPFDVLRSGIWAANGWGSGATGAGLEPLLMIIGGRTGTYIVGAASSTLGTALEYPWGFEHNRADIIARFPSFVSVLTKAWTSSRPEGRDGPTTIWEEGTVTTAQRPTAADDGTSEVFVGAAALFPRYTYSLPLYVAPGNVFWTMRPGAVSQLVLGFTIIEP